LSVERSDLSVQRSSPRGAVFVSYASEDAVAATRLCEALRAAGVEVWFDQSELAGGDAWDAKIRGQIATCALFVPVISAHTQARLEGYFRIEWKLAAQRTHAMAEEKTFLLPVVVDATRDSEARVPAEFRSVQWTRLPEGSATSQFLERVKKLLGSEVARAFPPVETVDETDSTRSKALATSASSKRPALRLWAALAVILIIGVTTIFILTRKRDLSPPANSKPQTQNSEPSRLAADAKSIAVLPFANMSDNKDANAFFADGMHDELLSALAKIGALKVISRTSVLVYRDPAKQRNLKQIAAELGVAHILEGSVSRSGKSVRIIVQLIDAATDAHRWAETYNLKEVTDVFQVQADIAAKIANSLAATISPEQKLALAQKLTSNPAAYDFYLRGRRWRESGDREPADTRQWEELVIRPLEQAVALDPTFAAAYAELGSVHGWMYFLISLDPTPQRLAKAKDAIDAALRLDPTLPEAHVALGNYHFYGFLDYARATEEYAIALAARPGDAEVIFYLGATQRRQGRWTEAIANFERVFAISPRRPGIGYIWSVSLYAQRRYQEVEKAADRVLAFDRANKEFLGYKADARFARDGDAERYRASLAATRGPAVNPRQAQFAQAFNDGRYAEAVRIYDEAPEEFRRGYQRLRVSVSRFDYYFAATAIGEREKARTRALSAIADTRVVTEERRDDWIRIARLAMLHVYAAQPDEARRLADRTLEMMPLKRDAVDGARALNEIARVHLELGDHDRALALLDQALSVPNMVSANEILHFEPWWKPLHNDPRFKAALAKAAPRE
jgi:TolB-like protein